MKRNISSVYMDGRTTSAYSGRRKAFERQKQELLSDIDAGRIRIEPPRRTSIRWKFRTTAARTICTGTGRYPRNSREGYSCSCARNGFFWPEAYGGILERQVACVWNSGKEFYSLLDYMFMNPDRDTDSQRLRQRVSFAGGFYRD
ncbi:MAG: hypothetical protein ACLUVG_07770 [Phocaeicola vulgatus]